MFFIKVNSINKYEKWELFAKNKKQICTATGIDLRSSKIAKWHCVFFAKFVAMII
jgi:hypothetical protein